MADTTEGGARPALILGAVSVACFLAGPLLSTADLVPPMAGFVLFALGGLLAVLTFVIALVIAARRGFTVAGPAFVLGLLVTGTFAVIAMPGRDVPRINDITTDTANPPQFIVAGTIPANQGRDMRYPGPTFADQQRAFYTDLAGLPLDMPPDAAFQKVLAAARQMPDWEVIRSDQATHTLEGVATSKWFHFKDDFVIEVRPDGTGSLVQMRSKSRDGRSDLGANAARIRKFFGKLQS
ncbi:DUF1499 domain-containing protein [Candidatus Binatia bacterium]|nr:DUF1499 domain-containing protein [Candidatus Binatia bacterium]